MSKSPRVWVRGNSDAKVVEVPMITWTSDDGRISMSWPPPRCLWWWYRRFPHKGFRRK